MRTVLAVALVYVLAMRAFEVARSRRNRERILSRGGRAVTPDGFGAIALVHGLWCIGLVVEEWFVGPTLGPPGVRVGAGALFVASEGVRLWCIAALGDRWNVRVVIAPEPPVTKGPYALVRHPNYLAALAGLVALPAALGLTWTAVVVLPLKLAALRPRIRIEERALGEADEI